MGVWTDWMEERETKRKKKAQRELWDRILTSPRFTFEAVYNDFVTQPALTKAFNNWIKTS